MLNNALKEVSAVASRIPDTSFDFMHIYWHFEVYNALLVDQ